MRVVVNNAVTAAEGDLKINLQGADRNFRIWSRRMVQPETVAAMAPQCRDLLLIASVVFAADSRSSRGSTSRAEFGEPWYREFEFVIPVADPEFWRSAERQLAACLEFLTGDRFRFFFIKRCDPLPRQGTLFPWQRPFEVDEVILFSGGLDSLTGAIDALSSGDTRVLLLTHRSAPKLAAAQKHLAA